MSEAYFVKVRKAHPIEKYIKAPFCSDKFNFSKQRKRVMNAIELGDVKPSQSS